MKSKTLTTTLSISQSTKKTLPYEAALNCYKKDTPNSKMPSIYPPHTNPKIELVSKCTILSKNKPS